MQQVTIKPKMQLDLYLYNKMTKRLVNLRKQSNILKLLILILLLWNGALTYNLFNTPIPQFTDEQIEIIMHEEEIQAELIGE
jgi:hypothetical protein